MSPAIRTASASSYQPLLSWLVCLSAGLFFLYEFFQLNLFDTINQDVMRELSLTNLQLGWVSASFLIANVLFLLPAGIILDRFAIRHVILAALALSVVGTFGFGVSHHFYSAFFFHFLSGIGNAFCFLACVMLVTQWFPPNRQALVIGVIVTMAFLGGYFAHDPLVLLKQQYGWRQSLFIDGLAGIGILALIALFVSEKKEIIRTDAKAAMPFSKSLSIAIINRQNWLLGTYTGILNLPIMVMCALWGTQFIISVYGLSQADSAWLMSTIFFGSMLGCPIIGWLSDVLQQRRIVMIICAGATFCLSLPICLGWSLSYANMQLLLFSLGFITSAQVLSYPLIAESNPPQVQGAATGLASILIMGGGMMGQLAYSGLLDWVSIGQLPGRTQHLTVMLMLPTLFFIAFVLSFFIVQPPKKEEAKENTHVR